MTHGTKSLQTCINVKVMGKQKTWVNPPPQKKIQRASKSVTVKAVANEMLKTPSYKIQITQILQILQMRNKSSLQVSFNNFDTYYYRRGEIHSKETVICIHFVCLHSAFSMVRFENKINTMIYLCLLHGHSYITEDATNECWWGCKWTNNPYYPKSW